MRILPVLDLLHGFVVRGIAGQRSEYRPIETPLCPSADPVAVACAIREKFGLDEFYVADLDAIAGAEPAWPIYQALMASGMRLLVDAGVTDRERCAAIASFRADRAALNGVIVGLESLLPIGEASTPETLVASLAPLVAVAGATRLIFSIDLKTGRPLTNVPAWQQLTPPQIAELAASAGVRRLIVLDLADVGVGDGVRTLDLCREIRTVHPQVELIAGGGVRGPDDLRSMAAAGCDAALVASALHDGRLKVNSMDEYH